MYSAAVTAAGEDRQRSARLSGPACLSTQRPGIPCTACRDICPEWAIRIAERSARIDPAACSTCGRCVEACPTGAITLPAARPAQLYECSRSRRPEPGAIILPCLGGLSSAVLREALGGGDVTLIDRGLCAACPVSGGQARPWAEAVARVNAEATCIAIAARVHVRSLPMARWRARAAPRARSDNPARRAVFARFAQAGRAAAPADPLAGLPGPVATPGPQRRAAQLAALAGGAPLPRGLFPALAVASVPRDLHTLVRLCPTGALRVAETPGAAALIFEPTACVACGDCTRTGALGLRDRAEGTLDGPETLITQARATCTACRGRFSPRVQETRCDACARDTDLAALAHGLRRR